MLKRLTDELWTSCLIRNLELKGLPVSEFHQTTYDTLLAKRDFLDIERRVSLEKVAEKHFVYDCFAIACLEERALLSVPPDDEAYYIEFFFQPFSDVYVTKKSYLELEGFLSKYNKEGKYDPAEVIDDIVDFAENPYATNIRDV